MDFTGFLLWKAIALVVIAFVGNFLHTLITGRSIEEARRERRD
ncbi:MULTISPECIES: hypothetical protein [unclassified Variovorax]|jgi:heme exporter protein D|nr:MULTISPECIES: hypothetical protein [unclassified Variovorax]